MDTPELLSQIDIQIARLEEARAILAGNVTGARVPKGRPVKQKRTLSAEARARISAAQKKRWAALKKAAK